MGPFRYACWAFCLVQVALVYARPEFGTNLVFPQSASVASIASRLEELFFTVDDALGFVPSGIITDSQAQAELLTNFATNVSIKGAVLAEAFQTAVEATDDVAGVFGSLLTAYDTFIGYVNDNNEEFFGMVLEQFGTLLKESLVDSMRIAFLSLQDFGATLEELQASVETAVDAEDVSEDLLRSVQQTLQSVQNHLPVVVYVFQRAGVNLQDAEFFYEDFDMELETMNNLFSAGLAEFSPAAEEFENVFLDGFLRLSNAYTAELFGLGDVVEPTVVEAISERLESLVTDIYDELIDPSATGIPAAVDAYSLAVDELVRSDFFNGPEVYRAPDALTSFLIESDVNAEYCFNKYRGLVQNLPAKGVDQLYECLDRERPRLGRIQPVVDRLTSLLVYDAEDVRLNFKSCASAEDPCVEEMAVLYENLAEKHRFKYETLKQLVELELHASEMRLAICLNAANFFTFDNLVATLVEDMEICFNGQQMRSTKLRQLH